jgi:AP2 domain
MVHLFMPAPKRELRHIRRIQRKNNTYSWHVTINRMNKAITKHFSDSTYGGSDQALKAAILFRDEKLKELDNSEYALWKKRLGRHPRNTSGIPGVGRYLHKYKNKQGDIKEIPTWQAFWSDPDGKRHIKTFYVSQYGEEGAKQRAIEARKQAMIELYGKADIMTSEEAQKTENIAKQVHQNTIEQPAPKSRRSISGKIERGAFLRYSKVEGKHIAYPYWRASWLDDESREFSARFTVYRHGEEKAFKLALEALEAALKKRSLVSISVQI